MKGSTRSWGIFSNLAKMRRRSQNWIATIAIVGLSTEGSNRKNRLRERLPESSDVLWAREM